MNICPEIEESKKELTNITMLTVDQLKVLLTLDVSNSEITSQGADMLAAILPETISLKELNISNATLNAAEVSKISNALRSVSSLKEFIFSNNGIDDKAANSITNIICSNCFMENLDISHNKLSSVGMLQIANCFLVTKNIKKINISHNYITSDNIEDLFPLLSQCLELQDLNVSWNLLKLTGVLKISQCFRHHRSLQSLDLSNNNISFPSTCEFIVDIILSVNQQLDNLNVCGRNIRPRFIEGYLSPPNSEEDTNRFMLQNLHLLQHASLNTVIQTKFIKATESCPLSEDIISYHVDHNGGMFYNQYHNFSLVIPPDAVLQGECVEIQTTASYFGPYKIPKGFYPISSFFWLSANYTFKVPVYVIMNHYAKIKSVENIAHLYVLQANEDSSMNVVLNKVYFGYETDYCVLATEHFCSYCEAKKDKHIPDYLEAYFCTFKDVAEVCFYPSSTECRKVTSKGHSKTHNYRILLIWNSILNF